MKAGMVSMAATALLKKRSGMNTAPPAQAAPSGPRQPLRKNVAKMNHPTVGRAVRAFGRRGYGQ
jgi:hypothetical protein